MQINQTEQVDVIIFDEDKPLYVMVLILNVTCIGEQFPLHDPGKAMFIASDIQLIDINTGSTCGTLHRYSDIYIGMEALIYHKV